MKFLKDFLVKCLRRTVKRTLSSVFLFVKWDNIVISFRGWEGEGDKV